MHFLNKFVRYKNIYFFNFYVIEMENSNIEIKISFVTYYVII